MNREFIALSIFKHSRFTNGINSYSRFSRYRCYFDSQLLTLVIALLQWG